MKITKDVRKKSPIARGNPPTEFLVRAMVREKELAECEHRHFYEDDSDGIFRCSFCNKIIDPDEVEGGLEEEKEV